MAPNLVGNSILAIERELILQTLEYCAGNRTHAAKLLKISLRALRYKLRDYEAQGFSVAKVTPAGRRNARCERVPPQRCVSIALGATSMASHKFSRPVIGPLGDPLTRADLPSAGSTRWVMRRKAEVVLAVEGGLLSLEDACGRYSLTLDEFSCWQHGLAQHGLRGLRVRSSRQAIASGEKKTW